MLRFSVPLRLLIPLLTILSGCAGIGKHRPTDDPWVRNAESRLSTGDYEGAARIFEERAIPSGYPDYFRLRAADAHLRAGDSATAQALVATVDARQLDDGDRTDYFLLAARVDLNAGRAAEAQALLDKVATARRDRSQDLHYHLLRASAYNQTGQMLDSARERVALAPLLTGSDAVEKNNAAIFDALNRLPDRDLDKPAAPPPDALTGWMALTRILRTESDAELSARLREWRVRFPDHPADGAFLDQVLQESGRPVEIGHAQATEAPVVPPPPAPTGPAPVAGSPFVGVLLPLAGSFAPAGEAIRAGMLAAFYSDPSSDKLPLRFVDSASSDVARFYKDFVAQGAALMVGPLLKEQVAKALQIPERPIPILALNEISAAGDANFIQFGLTPEQEVEQAAGAAWFDGHHHAVLLAPNSAFGQRLATHFSAYWKSLGGRILAAKTYTPNASDYSAPVQAVASAIGVDPAAAQPVVERKSDFVFLIANARDARLIKPQFDARQLSSFPIYATSHVFSGRPDPQRDRDLDGIYFCDVPWLLHSSDGGPLSASSLNSEVAKTAPDFVKLIALGIDAYRLGTNMVPMARFGGHLFDGATGLLTLQSGNRVQRQLECAQFEQGVPQPRGLAPMLHPAEPGSRG